MCIGDTSAREFLEDNECIWDQYLERYNVVDRDVIKYQIYMKSPILGMRALIDYQRTKEEKIELIKNDLRVGRGNVIVVAGKVGGGKSATAWLLMQWAHEQGRECYFSGIPQPAAPEWAHYIADPVEAPVGSVLYVPETAIIYSSRTSMSAGQRDSLSMLFTLRHGARTFIAETQAMRALDVQFLRTMQTLVLKPEPMLMLDDKDPAKVILDYLKPIDKESTLYYAKGWFTLLTETPLPDFWSDELSIPCKPITDSRKAEDYAYWLYRDQGFNLRMVQRVMAALGVAKRESEWEEIIGRRWIAEHPETVMPQRIMQSTVMESPVMEPQISNTTPNEPITKNKQIQKVKLSVALGL